MTQVSVTIDGKTYRMACDPGQDHHIKALAERLDEAIQTLKQGFGEIGDHRLAIMAGIMMADALSEEERKNAALESELSTLKDGKDALYQRFQQTEDSLCQTLLTLTARLESIASKLQNKEAPEAPKQHAAE